MIAIPKLLLLRTVFFFLVWALPMIINPKFSVGLIEKLTKNTELSFLLGFILLVIAFLYLLVYVNLDGTWYMMFSIIGYLTLLKWAVMMSLPRHAAKNAKRMYGTASMTRIMWILTLVVAAFILRATLVKF